MELKHVKIFVLAANLLNFTKVAEFSFLSQSSVTKYIQCLEEELGGKLFLRGDCRNLKFPPQVTADIASFEDLQGIMDDLKEYCSDFHYDLKTILSSPFTLVTPNSKNPYKQMYVAN